jgi:hypothetical protein
MTDKTDTDPAVVAARDIHKSLQQAIVEHPIDGFESDAIPRIRTAYAQRDKALAELVEWAFYEGRNTMNLYADFDFSTAKEKLATLMEGEA